MDKLAPATSISTDPTQPAAAPLRFDRVELAGAFGDLGTLLPIVVGMILINKLSPSTVFLSFGLFYLVTGYYYRLPVPVQPLKAVGAIAIAYPALITAPVIGASGIIFGALLLLFALTGIVDKLAKLFTQPVVRGIQLSLGLVFLKKGIELIVSPQVFLNGLAGRWAEYHINLIIGVVVFALVMGLLDNKKFPAALVALAAGILSGFVLGGFDARALSIGPTDIRIVSPSLQDFWTAFIMLILPQIPLTIGNACVGTADTCCTLFPQNPSLCQEHGREIRSHHGDRELPGGILRRGAHVPRNRRPRCALPLRCAYWRGSHHDRCAVFVLMAIGLRRARLCAAGHDSEFGAGGSCWCSRDWSSAPW